MQAGALTSENTSQDHRKISCKPNLVRHFRPWVDLNQQVVGLIYPQLGGTRMADWAFPKSSVLHCETDSLCVQYLPGPASLSPRGLDSGKGI